MPYSSLGATTDAAHQRLTASQSSICVFLLSLSHVGHHIPISDSFVLCTYIHFQYTAFGFQALRLQVQVVLKRLLSDLLLHKFSFQLFSQQMFALVNCINFDWTQSICWDLILDHGCNARSLSFISNKGPEWIGASSSSAWCGMYGTEEMEG